PVRAIKIGALGAKSQHRRPLRKISVNRSDHFAAEVFRLGLKDMGWKSAERAVCSRGRSTIRTTDCGSRIERESGKLRMRGPLSIEKADEQLPAFFLRHEKRIAKNAKLLVAGRFRNPAALHHATADRNIPQNSITIGDQSVVRRASVRLGKSRLIGESRIKHIGDVKQLVTQKRDGTLL